MSSKRYKKLPENLKENKLDTLEKLLPLIKKIVLQNLMRL